MHKTILAYRFSPFRIKRFPMELDTCHSFEVPPGEGLRRLALALICLGSVAVAVVFSPAAGLVDLRPNSERMVSFQP